MIAVHEAFSILDNAVSPLKVAVVPLWEARNHVLAETVLSPINMPPFRQSNMDGFALALHNELDYEIVGEIKAGDNWETKLQPGQAVKIFTGAAVPHTAQAVIEIEKATVIHSKLILQGQVNPENNVRPFGAQIKQNEVALQKGTLLNPAAIGFLAGLGFTQVKVVQKPKVGIVITGNELVPPGQPLPKGKVYESNAIMLQAALYNAHFEKGTVYQVEDDFEKTKNTIAKAIHENEVVLVSGGISVGDYDFVAAALQALEVTSLFYKINQKPGKPLWAGKQRDTFVFALPGNPASGLTCFYVYVLPTLHKLSGIDCTFGSNIKMAIAHDFEGTNTRAQFLKATVSKEEVTLLSHQESSMLNTYAVANALVYLPEGWYQLSKGDKVALYLI